MRGPASPAFTARIADVEPIGVQSLLELRLFLPGEGAAVDNEKPLPYEYLLQNLRTGTFVHFLIGGVTVTGRKQLHRLCLHLLHVRETLFDGLLSVTEN